ncbi:MAG: hypothetical protein R6X06_08745 [Gammaproteobacteria bacterium]
MHAVHVTPLTCPLSLPLPIFYGICAIVAASAAGFPAVSYAELSTRFPRSTGEAQYVREGLGLPQLALIIGLVLFQPRHFFEA